MKVSTVLLLTAALTACGGGGSTPNNNDNGSGNDDGGTGGGSGRVYGTPTSDQIRPGVRVSSRDGSCTSNFIFSDRAGDLYIGAAAHCFSPDSNSGVDSCETDNQSYGSAITIENATEPGSLVYSSWREMQDNGETPGSNACRHNDLAIIKINPADYPNVHPSAIAWGGPTSLLTGNAANGDVVYSYGQSSSHQGIRSREEKEGVIQSQGGGGWIYTINFGDNPGLPGDSGSAVLHQSGQALAVLTVVQASPCVGICSSLTNGVLNLEMALDYANDSQSSGYKLETWSSFDP